MVPFGGNDPKPYQVVILEINVQESWGKISTYPGTIGHYSLRQDELQEERVSQSVHHKQVEVAAVINPGPRIGGHTFSLMNCHMILVI